VVQGCSLEAMDATSSSWPTLVSESQEQMPFETMLEEQPQASGSPTADSEKNRLRIRRSSQRTSKKVRLSTTEAPCQQSAEEHDIGKYAARS
jgi:hypothetical protein